MLKISPERGTASKRKPNAAQGIRKPLRKVKLKSFNHLFEPMVEDIEIEASIYEAAESKHSRPPVQSVLADLKRNIRKIKYKVVHGEWRPPSHKRSILQEGSHRKSRDIEKPEWNDEQIIHHMLMRQFRKIVVPRTYRYACGAFGRADERWTRVACNPARDPKKKVKGRGPLFAVTVIRRWIDGYNGRKFYVAELDIKSFYNTIDLDVLKAKLRKLIRDKRYLDLLFKVIDGSAPGLPKGYYTSPWLANFYLMDLDNYIQQELKPDHYLRYMDNFFLFGVNKKKLHRIVIAIQEYLHQELHLALNSNWQVYRFEYERNGQVKGRAINALGFVIHRDRVTLRKSILKRSRAKANRMHRLHRCTRLDAACMVSYRVWYKHTDTYRYFQKWIKPKVSIRYCRLRLSKYAKAANKRRKQHDGLEDGPRLPAGSAGGSGHQVEPEHCLHPPEHPAGDGAGRHGR